MGVDDFVVKFHKFIVYVFAVVSPGCLRKRAPTTVLVAFKEN
jgi:hypothetical protein